MIRPAVHSPQQRGSSRRRPAARRTCPSVSRSSPEPWKPEVGANLVGEVIGVEQRDGEFGSYPIVIVITEDGSEFAFHGFHTVAKNELAKQRPAVGDKIAIKSFGRTEDDRGYERYRILVDKPQAALDWDAIGEQAEAELGEEEPADLPMPDGD
jgi:hypothetical protein